MMEHNKFSIGLAILPLTLLGVVSGAEWSVTYSASHLCAVQGSSVEMTCSYTFPPNLTVQTAFWTLHTRRDANDLTEESAYANRTRADCGDKQSRCRLTLSGVKEGDQRKYFCRVVTQQDAQSWTGKDGVKLTVTGLRVVSPGYLREGKAVTLTCASNCTLTGNPHYTWTKDGRQVQGRRGRLLHLSSLSSADEGTYTCAVENHIHLPSPPLTITIIYSPRDVQAFIRPSGVVHKGSTVTLTCSSDANPPVESYTWFKVNESSPLGSGQQFTITNISSEDARQYYCEARNGVGAENSTFIAIALAEECHCSPFLAVSVPIACGLLSLACVGFLISSIVIRCCRNARGGGDCSGDVMCCRKARAGSDGSEDEFDDDDAAEEQEDADEDNYENLQMSTHNGRAQAYTFQDDDEVYQNVDELCIG